ncbi:6-hydroxymethylpterin diphosphokinase MptE-like protein [Longibaculum muris]|uniref:6-hydroxymethylpterin diphosphokinase MptE-like protein n=1 Tax=Longibaculum muris TaxID=1796628 RepID=UPI003AB5B345
MFFFIKYIFTYKIFKKNKKLLNRYKGKRCFIVLNGPSLLNYDLSVLKNEYVFCTNFMYLSKEIVDLLRPNFYCWTDATIFNKENCDSILENLFKSCEHSIFFFPFKYLKRYHEVNQNVFLTYNNFLPTLKKVHCSLNGKFSSFNTVAFYCIAIAISLGFKEIYLLGLDFEPGGFVHFEEHGKYTDTTLESDNKLKVCTEYKQYSQAQFESFYIQKEAKRRSVNIYNLNKKSFIRSFEFKEFEDIL